MNIPTSYIIHDIRSEKDFKNITICGYKRKDVINAYQNSIINNKLEDAIRWCTELHSTGLNNAIWDSLKITYIKYIHINNPKYLFYILKREKDYNRIIENYPKKHEIFTRNNQEIRNLYAELTSISCLTKKNNLFLPKSLPTINSKSFEKVEIKKRVISRNFDNIIDYLHKSSTNEMRLAYNEIFTNISSKHGTLQNCLYWYLWLEKVENNRKNEDRNNIVISKINNEDKYYDHWTTILWNIILDFRSNLPENDTILLKKIHHIYKKNFKPSQISKKKYYFFIAFYILKENIKWNINIFVNEYLIIQANANINKMYETIIKNIESNLSFESKSILYKKYNILFNNMNNDNNKKIIPKKIIDTHLNDDINKVIYTNYPEYKELNINEEDEENYNIKKEKLREKSREKEEVLISKNMSLKDINDQKIELKDKKLDAFKQFVAYKIKKNNDKPKNILEYYTGINNNTSENNEKNIYVEEFKNINFKKNSKTIETF
jgi:hypothetical protein